LKLSELHVVAFTKFAKESKKTFDFVIINTMASGCFLGFSKKNA